MVGQSFQAVSGNLQRITLDIATTGDTGNTMELRIGTTNDLTTYLGSSTKLNLAGSNEYDFIFSPVIALTGGNTYYFILSYADGDASNYVSLTIEQPSIYGNGYYAEGTSWVLGDAINADAYFQVWMCD